MPSDIDNKRFLEETVKPGLADLMERVAHLEKALAKELKDFDDAEAAKADMAKAAAEKVAKEEAEAKVEADKADLEKKLEEKAEPSRMEKKEKKRIAPKKE